MSTSSPAASSCDHCTNCRYSSTVIATSETSSVAQKPYSSSLRMSWRMPFSFSRLRSLLYDGMTTFERPRMFSRAHSRASVFLYLTKGTSLGIQLQERADACLLGKCQAHLGNHDVLQSRADRFEHHDIVLRLFNTDASRDDVGQGY